MSPQQKIGQPARPNFRRHSSAPGSRAQPPRPMPTYSHSPDPLSPPASPTTAAAEAELRHLVDYISTTLPKRPSGDFVSEILSFTSQTSRLGVLDEWIDNLGSSLDPLLIARIKHLVVKLLEKKMASPMGLAEMLKPLKDRAAGVGGLLEQNEEALLRARKALFLGEEEIQSKEYPCPKRLKRSQETIPVRRSTRTHEISLPQLEKDVIRKRVGIGEDFQADVPDWKGLLNEEDPDDLRLLGTEIWPGDDVNVGGSMSGKGRPESCRCKSAGSIDCVKLHIRASRARLRSELSQAFASWEFDNMGEEVAKSWTREEQKTFHELVVKNPPSEGENFWKPALEHFSWKSSREIASYYFNVYVLRRMRDQIRSKTGEVDSDDDESNIGAHDNESHKKYLQSYNTSSQRCNTKKPGA